VECGVVMYVCSKREAENTHRNDSQSSLFCIHHGLSPTRLISAQPDFFTAIPPLFVETAFDRIHIIKAARVSAHY
jgi:hypothetical protein